MEDGALNVIISVSPHGPHIVRDWTTMMIMINVEELVFPCDEASGFFCQPAVSIAIECAAAAGLRITFPVDHVAFARFEK
jgi:hypothetical protein